MRRPFSLPRFSPSRFSPSRFPPSGPSAAAREPKPVHARRSARDWAADIGLFLFAATFSVAVLDLVVIEPDTSETARFLDLVAGAAGCAALFLRRRWPVQLAVVLLVAGSFGHFMTGPSMVALFTVAATRPPWVTRWVTVLAFAPLVDFLARAPEAGETRVGSGITYFALIAGALGWGRYVRSRRLLVASLRERAARAGADARREAREDIAREMHDVLAHRLSLLSVHAGALEFNPAGDPAQIQRAAGVIRESAHQALDDLREVIGVLRSPEHDGRPQPVLADLERLAEESRTGGMRVTLRRDVTAPEAVPPVAGRTAYRVVQEGLTNVRKHGSASATVAVTGGPGEGLGVEVRNPVRTKDERADREERAVLDGRREPQAAAGAPIPGAGQGLIGLAERVTLAGGEFEHGREGTEFRLYARLPWPR